mgnify:CR=1 FL=1
MKTKIKINSLLNESFDNWFMRLSLAIVILAMIITGCAKSDYHINGPVGSQSTSSPTSSPISVKLTVLPLSEPLTLESQANLIMEVSVHPSYSNTLNATANIILPEGIALVSGETIWNGELKAGSPITLSAIVRVNKVGNYTIEASAKHYFGEPSAEYPLGDSWVGDVENICFSASEDKATIISGECQNKLLHEGRQELRTETERESEILINYTDPFKGTFEGSDEPKLGSSARIIFSFTPDNDMKDVDVKFNLPIGVTLLEGKTEWKGEVANGQKIELPIKIQIQAGENEISPISVKVSGYEKDALVAEKDDVVAITERFYYYGINTPVPTSPLPTRE